MRADYTEPDGTGAVRKHKRALWLWLANVIGLSAFSIYVFIINPPPSQATLSLQQALVGVNEVRIRVGCMSRDSGYRKRVVLTLKEKAAGEFVQSLHVKYVPRTITPLKCNNYTFEFYRQNVLVAEVGYFPNLVIWRQHTGYRGNWRDGHTKSSGRALTWKSKRYLRTLLAPYEDLRKADLHSAH